MEREWQQVPFSFAFPSPLFPVELFIPTPALLLFVLCFSGVRGMSYHLKGVKI